MLIPGRGKHQQVFNNTGEGDICISRTGNKIKIWFQEGLTHINNYYNIKDCKISLNFSPLTKLNHRALILRFVNYFVFLVISQEEKKIRFHTLQGFCPDMASEGKSRYSQLTCKWFVFLNSETADWILLKQLIVLKFSVDMLFSLKTGGNSKTAMIAAISPADINFEETLSTLRYMKSLNILCY